MFRNTAQILLCQVKCKRLISVATFVSLTRLLRQLSDRWRLPSCGMWRLVLRQKFADVPEERIAHIFRHRWRQGFPLKNNVQFFTRLHLILEFSFTHTHPHTHTHTHIKFLCFMFSYKCSLWTSTAHTQPLLIMLEFHWIFAARCIIGESSIDFLRDLISAKIIR